VHSRIFELLPFFTFVRSPNGLRTLLLSSIACNAEARAAGYSNQFEYPAGFEKSPYYYIRPESEWTPYILILQHCHYYPALLAMLQQC
jgi:hypothetical protein